MCHFGHELTRHKSAFFFPGNRDLSALGLACAGHEFSAARTPASDLGESSRRAASLHARAAGLPHRPPAPWPPGVG